MNTSNRQVFVHSCRKSTRKGSRMTQASAVGEVLRLTAGIEREGDGCVATRLKTDVVSLSSRAVGIHLAVLCKGKIP